MPSLIEQRAIAAVLSDVDALIGALDKLIAKKRAIKLATMQELLNGKTRLPGFRGEWTVKEIKELADVDPENLSSSTDPNYAFNYISLEQVMSVVWSALPRKSSGPPLHGHVGCYITTTSSCPPCVQT